MSKFLVCNRSISGKRWFLHNSDNGVETSLFLGEHKLVRKLLIARGINISEAHNFLEPKLKNSMSDPSHLKDLDNGVDRLTRAIENKELISILGDYDVDGICSSALLQSFLREVGCQINLYIPDRIKDGYGPSQRILEEFIGKGSSVVITVDCGTTAFKALEFGSRNGLDIIVVDHHKANKNLPEAYAVINPNRLDDNSCLKTLSSVGLCFMLSVAITRSLRDKSFFIRKNIKEPNLINLLDLVALGTVCDVVSLRGLNRAFVTQGLRVIKKNQRIGLKALVENSGIRGCVDAYHIGFLLGPRINAGGRIGRSDLGIDLLTTNSPYLANMITKKINLCNRVRKNIERCVLEKAIEKVESNGGKSVFVWGEGWHPGVLGIVAGRLKDYYNRPSIVISLGKETGVGSGRSIPGIDLGRFVQLAMGCNLIESGGGHAMAVGLSVRKNKLQDLERFFIENTFSLNINDDLFIDDFLPVGLITDEFFDIANRLAPYGEGNPIPRFIVPNLIKKKVRITEEGHIEALFASLNDNKKTVRAFIFRASESQVGKFLLVEEEPTALVGSLRRSNSYRGEKYISIVVDDVALMSSLDKDQSHFQ